jgi:hypothetical protein
VMIDAITVFTLAAALAGPAAQELAGDDRPWQVGHCYRVFLTAREPSDTFKVIVSVSPSGPWVRVQPDPANPKWPGPTPTAPLWINTAIVFAAQQTACAGER